MRHKGERYAKGFNSWDHFVAMRFCQLAQVKSLREICGGLACCIGKLRHLGIKNAPKESTLSYANALKQNLTVKTLVGTTEDALCIHIWTALIAMLLIKLKNQIILDSSEFRLN